MPLTPSAIQSVTPLNAFFRRCSLASPVSAICPKASSMVPALFFMDSVFLANVSARLPVSGPMARKLSADPNSLP